MVAEELSGDERSRPLRDAVRAWARAREFGFSASWRDDVKMWLFRIYLRPRNFITVWIREDGSAFNVADGARNTPFYQGNTSRAVKVRLNSMAASLL